MVDERYTYNDTPLLKKAEIDSNSSTYALVKDGYENHTSKGSSWKKSDAAHLLKEVFSSVLATGMAPITTIEANCSE